MARITKETVKSITEKKLRISDPDRAVSWRISSLLQSFNNPTRHISELARYYPIAVVATIEGYFRARLAELIDHGDPFRSSAVVAYPDVKLDMTLANAIVEGRVTLGEIITHPIPLSSFESLIAAVSNITGHKDCLSEIAAIRKEDVLTKQAGALVMTDPARAWALLAEVFATRHILCHELASEFDPNPTATRELLLNTRSFLHASALWFNRLQHPDPTPTLEEHRLVARAELEAAEQRLEAVLNASPEIFVTEVDSAVPSRTILELQERVRSLVSFMDASFKDADPGWLISVRRDEAQRTLLNHVSAGLEQWLFAYEVSEHEREVYKRLSTEFVVNDKTDRSPEGGSCMS
jgi:hypothetical protein